jgi:hypothetical protein
MKKIITIILVAFLVLIGKNLFAQNTGTAYIENPQVNGLVFSWELHFQRTNVWTPGLLQNALGNSSASFNFNTLGLTNPSLVVEPGGPLDNANYPSVTAHIINDKCIVNIQFTLNALAGQLPLNIKTKLLTVSMDITNSSFTAGLIWDALNTGFFDNADVNVVTTLTGSADIPLPVELTSFTAKYLNDKVHLNWVTKTEVNNYGFNIERRTKEDEWNSIGFVEGNGTTTESKEYSYSDKDIFTGGNKFQYRLKQIDNDGSFEYSDVVEVEVVPTQFELFQNYPNPFNPSTTIRFSLPKETQLKINVYNMLGENVGTIAEGTYEAGFHTVTFSAIGGSASGGNASTLSSGAYIYRIESDAFVQVKKMLLLK